MGDTGGRSSQDRIAEQAHMSLFSYNRRTARIEVTKLANEMSESEASARRIVPLRGDQLRELLSADFPSEIRVKSSKPRACSRW